MKIVNTITALKQLQAKLLLLIILLSGLTFSDLLAQKGNNQIAIGVELGPVVTDSWNDYRFQAGLPIKAYLGTGKHGQWMFRSGIHHLWVPSQDLIQQVQSLTGYIVPVALGYRHNISNWYVEGSVGMAWERNILNYVSHDLEVATATRYPINFGVEVGYQINNLDIGLSLQNNLIRHRYETGFMVLVGFKALYRFGF